MFNFILGQTFDLRSTKLDSYLLVVQASTMSISFRFIHTATATPTEDDRCVVTRNGDGFTLSYTYNERSGKTTNTVDVDANGVLQWVRRAIDMLERDTKPLDSMQIDFPMLPSILFAVSDLGNHYHAILDAVEFTLDNWPTKAPLQRQNAFYQAANESTTNESTTNESTTNEATNGLRSGVTTRSQLRQHLFMDE